MYTACKPTTAKEWWIKRVNRFGIDVGKKKCRAALKDERGNICSYPWIRIHDTFE
jgi:hypothetical protein